MDQQFEHLETREIVRITNDMGNFFLLNNGAKIDKQLFFQKYVPRNNKSAGNIPSVNAEDFLNTRPTITTKSNMQPITENQSPTFSNDAPIDPNQFLNIPPSIKGVESLKQIDTSKMLDAPESQRVQVRDHLENPVYPNQQGGLTEQQKQEMIKNYQRNQNIGGTYIDENDPNAIDNVLQQVQKPRPKQALNENGLTEHQEILRQQQIDLTGEDPFAEKIRIYREEQLQKKKKEDEEREIERVKQQIANSQQPIPIPIYPKKEEIAPVSVPTETVSDSVFKKFKRSYEVTIKFEIKDKISKPDFIKVMSDGFEDDILQYYTDEIFKTFLNDVVNLKKKIYDQLQEEVYGKEVKETEPKPAKKTEPKPAKRTVTKTESKPVKKTTTTKPRSTKTKSKE